MLARAAAAAAAARRARPVHRAASVLATAGLDADTSDLFALATDFAARELAPHSEAWDRDSVRGGRVGVSAGVAASVGARAAPPDPLAPHHSSTSPSPPCAPPRARALPRCACRPRTAARG